MLDRILNINPQDKYKSGFKLANQSYAVSRHDQEKHNSRDSALISPLARLLSKINWKILNIEYPSEDEILLNFLVNEFEFLTLVNLNEIYDNPFQEFKILNYSIIDDLKIKTELILTSKKWSIDTINEPNPILTENIEYLFDRINTFSNYKQYTTTDKVVLSNFIIAIENQINEELEYILQVIYTFISTRFPSKIKHNFNLKTEGNNPIIMQEVAIIHTE